MGSSKRQYSVGVVGAGLVGEALVELLEERAFPLKELRILATSSREQEIAGRMREVTQISNEAFRGLDIALFAGTEGESGAAQTYGWEAVERGVFVVDNGSDFRMDSRVPLVIPEVNAGAMQEHQGFVANPNCSTIQMVVAVAPLHRHAGIRRVVVSTYQSVSGTGRSGVRALTQQREAQLNGSSADCGPYPHPILDNCIPEIGSLKSQDKFSGYFSEEIKMIEETRKILATPDLPVSATCVRVPVRIGHSEALNVELGKKISVREARDILSAAPGVEVLDAPESSQYPLAADAGGKDGVYVGRIRQDPSKENTLDLWCVSDNIRKGAALNTLQIAEKAIEMELI